MRRVRMHHAHVWKLDLRPDIKHLFKDNEIICLQETWFAKQDLKHINNLNKPFQDDLSDDDDINRQRRTLFVQGNIILRKFNMCSLGVKLTLFRTYCSPM